MAPRSTPFNIVVHFSGKKTNAEISRVVHKFYLDEIKNRLIESHLEDYEKQEVLERLIDRFSTPMNDTFNESK